ncbi:hypothetical protein DP113_15280 [Brasilonema octagenarum UFV-E1]|uniref:Uncharacterized protein n=1 Tax=Brasilonema sennae CENA114 TaxID=415709 RepID=A0A856MLH9_9CYAN|nr:hypothetical protein DP114_15340 [Brasilonema sennae CENA114]QDL18643.1 hypothetical protein DP113_15280 [Brasilonema octagenarum UFV-E1]
MIAQWLSTSWIQSLIILVTITLVGIPFPVIASKEDLNGSNEPEPLQTEITQKDLNIIEQLVLIAQRNSAQVQETKAEMGLSAFSDIVSVELSPSQTTTNLTLPEVSSVSEDSFSLTVTFDPIKLVSTIKKLPVIQARWNEAKLQKRVAIVKNYVAYLQARQAWKIAAYRMQKLSANRLNSQTTSPGSVDDLANADYVTAVTQMLSTSTNERVALEELAASVGLSLQKTLAIINGQ